MENPNKAANSAEKDLPFSASRRGFFSQLAREAKVTLDLFQGKQSFRLAELVDLPAEQIGDLRPMINPLFKVLVTEKDVIARDLQSGAEIRLFAAGDDLSVAILSRFDGQHTLIEVAQRVSKEMDLELARAWSHARAMFLELVELLVVVPRNPPGLLG